LLKTKRFFYLQFCLVNAFADSCKIIVCYTPADGCKGVKDCLPVVYFSGKQAHNKRVGHAAFTFFGKQFIHECIFIEFFQTLIQTVAAIAKMGMSCSDRGTDNRAVAGMVSGHFIAGNVHGKIFPAVF
jgi:hypothetical protein